MELDACNRIYVIESLRDNDNKTGTKLYNNILSQSWCISSKLYIVEDKKGWDDAINLIKEDCSTIGVSPIIHLEIHGSELGIGFADGSFISWEDVGWDFKKINKLCCCNLLVTLAVCHGAWLVKAFSTITELPFCGLIGSQEAIYESDLVSRFTAFYQELSTNNNLQEAINQLKSTGNPNAKYEVITAEEIFVNAYQGYIEKMCTPEALRQRAIETAKYVNIKNNQQLECFISQFIRIEKGTRLVKMQEFARSYFLLDKFPNNAKKFSIPSTLEELKELAEKSSLRKRTNI